MNNKGGMEGSSARIVGREFIIIIVVVFSSLSFTLGFFVGKNDAEKKAESVAQTVTQTVDTGPRQSATAEQPQDSGVAGNGMAPLQETNTAQQTVSLPPENAGGTDKTVVGHVEHKEAAGDMLKDNPKKEGVESTETNRKSAAKTSGDDAIYTVQLGALTNQAEARRLKAKYSQKGYKIYITVSQGKHKEKVYKVRAGEFKEKKEAEIFALRIKKNEGLPAFVAVKND